MSRLAKFSPQLLLEEIAHIRAQLYKQNVKIRSAVKELMGVCYPFIDQRIDAVFRRSDSIDLA